MSNSIRNLKLILIFLIIIPISNCSDPMNSKDPKIRLVAIKISTDQTKLVNIAINDRNEEVSLASVEKISNQEFLLRIVSESWNWKAREIALKKLSKPNESILKKIFQKEKDWIIRDLLVEKISDQKFLTYVALNDIVPAVRVTAIMGIIDYNLLLKLSCEDWNFDCRKAAIKKLREIADLKRIASNENFGWIHQIINAFSKIPEKHKDRILAELIPAFRFINRKEVVEILGNTSVIKVFWTPTSQEYHRSDYSGKKNGERIDCLLEFEKFKQKLSYKWETDFPYSVPSPGGFIAAKINAGVLIEPVMNRLSEDLINAIALKEKGKGIRQAAITHVNDQFVLFNITSEDIDYDIKIAAANRITDQSLLSRIALENNDRVVRAAAVKKISNQALLERIAENDSDLEVRNAAVNALSHLKRK